MILVRARLAHVWRRSAHSVTAIPVLRFRMRPSLAFFLLASFLFLNSAATAQQTVSAFENVIAQASDESPRNSEGDLVILKDGSILAAWSEFYGGNRDDSAGRISAKISKDGGKTWGERWTMVENTGGENVMSASFLRLKSTGELLLFYLEKNSKTDLRPLVRRSSDEGKTWSEPVTIIRDEGYWVMNNARVVQLSSGRIVCPVAMTEKVFEKGHRFRTLCFFSDDEGNTWRRGVGGAVAPKRGAMEPGLIGKADGTVLQTIRTQTGKQWFSESKNGGDTWSEAAPWTVVSPEAPATLAKMPGDRGWLIICNPTLDPKNSHGGKRTPLAAMTSLDEGKTWSAPKLIETDPAMTYSYISVDFHENRALLTYYVANSKNRLSWKFKSLPLDWFPVPKKPDTTVASVRTPMQSVMGKFPGDEKRVDLKIEIEDEFDAGSYVRRLITYQSEPNSRTPAYLCIPKAALAGKTKAPAVLCLHPTDSKIGHKVVVGLGGKPNRQYASELAERGFVTISPAYPHLADYYPNLGGLGYISGTMKAIWDNSRALDVLESLDFVDSERGFGAIGHSLGGHNAIYSAVFDNRISAVVSSCGFDSYSDYYDGNERVWFFGKGWCQIRYMPRMSDFRGRLDEIPFDFGQMLGVLSPRPIFVNAPLNDSNFRWKSVDRCVAEARRISPDSMIEVDHPESDHDFPDAQREKAYALFEKALKQ